MRPFLSIISLVFFCGAFAQSDSLWSVWKNSSLPDSARLKAISALSWKTVFQQPDSGIALAELQLQLARKSGDPKALFTAYNTLAAGNKMRSDLSAALDYFNRCLEVARSMNDRKRIASCTRACGSMRNWATRRAWPALSTTSATSTNG